MLNIKTFLPNTINFKNKQKIMENITVNFDF